ncbi:hypothetical protein HZ326_0269 [Fusarium oxysporum f. sp. albedinis]|nr:hypothetical protein HZ326_0269 [Fusarium oxysporum f. sp. albedinis]
MLAAVILRTIHPDQERQFMYRIIKQVLHVRISGVGVVARQFHYTASNLATLVFPEATADSRWQSFLPTPANLLYLNRLIFARLVKEGLIPIKLVSKTRGWLDKIHQVVSQGASFMQKWGNTFIGIGY